jgi:hypothetical protein
MQGAMLHSPCPMVVTIHDLSTLKRPSERLRGGGMHLRLRHLALQRAMQMIVPSELVAGEATELGFERERILVIPQPSDSPHSMAQHQQPEAAVASEWCWQDTARQTWDAYRSALTQPHRPYVIGRRQGINRRHGGR